MISQTMQNGYVKGPEPELAPRFFMAMQTSQAADTSITVQNIFFQDFILFINWHNKHISC